MITIQQFECVKCGEQFEEYVSSKSEKPRCPKCGRDETKIIIGNPKHTKHSSWGAV